jgi:hypothetical protein
MRRPLAEGRIVTACAAALGASPLAPAVAAAPSEPAPLVPNPRDAHGVRTIAVVDSSVDAATLKSYGVDVLASVDFSHANDGLADVE